MKPTQLYFYDKYGMAKQESGKLQVAESHYIIQLPENTYFVKRINTCAEQRENQVLVTDRDQNISFTMSLNSLPIQQDLGNLKSSFSFAYMPNGLSCYE